MVFLKLLCIISGSNLRTSLKKTLHPHNGKVIMREFYLTVSIIVELIIFIVSVPAIVSGKQIEKEGEILYPLAVTSTPLIDGVLDDDIWKNPPLEKDFITYDPLYGEVLPQKTLVLMGYDSDNLYFAFKCCDSEPQKIKTSITKRDNIFNDDWVGLSLDALGNRQSSYELYVNPNGIQGDILKTVVSGTDLSFDFVWESAGKLTDEGYQVEICVPLRSIRFKSGREVKMRILFLRKISRLGMKGSLPDLPPGQGVFNSYADVVYKNLKKSLNLEILPSATFSRNNERINPDEWGKSEKTEDIGIGLKYGITSSLTADVTVNPDFSQVESDAFQVEVNQRYPIFYSEKRPFFMEGMDIFDFFSLIHLVKAVHTRRIVNPLWGAKLAGTAGKTSFGILSAGDELADFTGDSGAGPQEGENAYSTIARGKRSLGQDNYVGGLYSGREFAGGYNRVTGADFGYRFLGNNFINSSFLQSISREHAGESSTTGSNLNLLYHYQSKRLLINTGFEHIGKGFRMDSAFLRRSDINNGACQIELNFYPNPQKLPWFKRITPSITGGLTHDLNTNMDDEILEYGLGFSFIKQGLLSMSYYQMSESWNNQTFDLTEFLLLGEVQITKWLKLSGSLDRREKIYYWADPSYKGDGYNGEFSFTLQPNTRFNQYFRFYYSDFHKNKDKIYDVNIIDSRTTYQFNKYFFIRGIVQYDSYQKRMLTDFLASFTLIPGTVIHAGYGGLYENREWSDNR